MTQTKKWYQTAGPEGDVVLSTRIRLARNIQDTPFPAVLTADQKAALAQTIRDALRERTDLLFFDMRNMMRMDALSMVERHLISPAFSACEEGSALLLSQDEHVSLMVCEEDHLRIQVMRAGMQLEETFAEADVLDSTLDTALTFAFDDRLGYLTQCPTNLGTGMRASLMLHLPALEESGALRQLAHMVSKLGLTIRGWYGEGSKSEGHIYQLSNQVTLGISEQAAMDNLKSIALQIIREERAERAKLADNAQYVDAMWRSLGILRYAHRLTHQELMEYTSYLRVGLATGILTDVTFTADDLNALMNDAQPATMMMMARKELEPDVRDSNRAAMVRERLV